MGDFLRDQGELAPLTDREDEGLLHLLGISAKAIRGVFDGLIVFGVEDGGVHVFAESEDEEVGLIDGPGALFGEIASADGESPGIGIVIEEGEDAVVAAGPMDDFRFDFDEGVQRMYKAAIVGDAVQNELNTSLFKYIDEEKLHILGMPMSNDEKTGEVDFGKQNAFTFYFDVAVAPEFELDWSKVDVKYNQIKVTAKEVEAEVNNVTNRYGKFETPEAIGAGDIMYGKLVELDKKGNVKEGGVDTFVSLNLLNLKDAELMPLFEVWEIENKLNEK